MKHKRSLSIAMATIVLLSLCAVYATTSVSAAPSSSAAEIGPAQSASANVPTTDLSLTSVSAAQNTAAVSSTNAIPSGALVGAPYGVVGEQSLCSQYARSLDLFVRGTDGTIWWRHEAPGGKWSTWTSIGKPSVGLTSSPSATVQTTNTIFVAVRGGDGALWRTFTTDAGVTWKTWYSWGGQLLYGTGPAAVSAEASVSYFVTGTTNHLYRWAGSVGSFQSLGGILTSSPSATNPSEFMGSGLALYVCGRGSNGALYYTYANDGTTWSGWHTAHGGILPGTSPNAVSPTTTSVRWSVTGTTTSLYWWTGSSWLNLHGGLTSGPAAASHISSAVDIVARGTTGALYSRWTTNAGQSWSPWYQWA